MIIVHEYPFKMVEHEYPFKVRDSVKYFKGSPSRTHKFTEIARQLQLSTSKRLILDVPTRWNSTYTMFESAFHFKAVFPRYQDRDPHYQSLPSYDDWEKAEKVMELLEIFNEATSVFSTSEYPTANLFLPEIWKIKELLLRTSSDESNMLKGMAMKMNEKFDKYWSECNVLMSVAAVLDPRNKMGFIHFCFPKMFPTDFEVRKNIEKVREAIYKLYEYYAGVYCASLSSVPVSEGSSSDISGRFDGVSGKHKTKGGAEFEAWARQKDVVTPLKSDLDVYLEEGLYVCADGESFDTLNWWRLNSLKFKILSKMERDILSVPATTVALESTFSAGGRVVDQYRSSLKPETVQALVCASDWIKSDYKLNKSAIMDDDDTVNVIRLE